MTLDATIEAILFFRGEPVSLRELSKLSSAPEADIRSALLALREKLAGRGIALMEANDEVELRTSPESAELIGKIRKEELEKNLGKASLETLAIVLYKGPVARSEIDYIRGVNSTFILRSLLIRGLVERIPNPNDQRSFLYRPSMELLGHLGARSIEELPDYATAMNDLRTFTETQEKAEDVPEESDDETDDANA